MHIIQEIKEMIGWVVKQVLLIVGFIIVAAIAPVILAVLPQVLISQDPQGDFSEFSTALFSGSEQEFGETQ